MDKLIGKLKGTIKEITPNAFLIIVTFLFSFLKFICILYCFKYSSIVSKKISIDLSTSLKDCLYGLPISLTIIFAIFSL
jgi:hypothetical protein